VAARYLWRDQCGGAPQEVRELCGASSVSTPLPATNPQNFGADYLDVSATSGDGDGAVFIHRWPRFSSAWRGHSLGRKVRHGGLSSGGAKGLTAGKKGF
jgi:hypothetical protein